MVTTSSGSGRMGSSYNGSSSSGSSSSNINRNPMSSSYAPPSATSTQYDRVLASINPNHHDFMSSTSGNSKLSNAGYSNIYDTINSIGYNNSSYLQNELNNKNNAAQLEQALLTPSYNYASRSKSVSLFFYFCSVQYLSKI